MSSIDIKKVQFDQPTPNLDALVEKWATTQFENEHYATFESCKQCALEWAKEVQEQHNNEIGEFQNSIKTLVDEKSGTNVDGAGCESGDWRDFTRSEIAQGLNHVIDQRDSALKSMATYGGIEDLLCPEFEGVDDLVECFRLLKQDRDQWKARAEKAEASTVKAIGKLLGGTDIYGEGEVLVITYTYYKWLLKQNAAKEGE